MTTSLAREINRFRGLTISLIVGITISVSVFTALLISDIERQRNQLLIQSRLYALETENIMTSVFAAITTVIDFLEVSSGIDDSRIRQFLNTSAVDLELATLFDQFCVRRATDEELLFRLADTSCPVPRRSESILSQELRLGSGRSAALHFLAESLDYHNARMIMVVPVDEDITATFSTSMSRLLTPAKTEVDPTFAAATLACMYRVEVSRISNIGCSKAPDRAEQVLDPDELARSSTVDYQHDINAFGLQWRLVTILRPELIATAISAYPVIGLLIGLLFTGLVSWYIYRMTDYALTLERKQRALRTAVHTLQERNEDLEMFSYMASHDLQTPVRHVLSRVTMLREDLETGDRASVERQAKLIAEAGERMQAFVLDLLEFCRAGQTDVRPTNVNMGLLVHEQIEVARDTAGNLPLSINIGDLPSIETDKVKVTQVVQNLLSNAVKFHRPGEPASIDIDARWSEQRRQWVFSVRDNGIGIPPDQISRVFLPFKQLSPEHRKQGTGIGLSITRKILARLGGEIWVESIANSGSVFYFSLPAVYSGDVDKTLEVEVNESREALK